MNVEVQIAGIAKAALKSDKILVQRLVAKLARTFEKNGQGVIAKELLDEVSSQQKLFSLQKATPSEALPARSSANAVPVDYETSSQLADVQMPGELKHEPILSSAHHERINEFIQFVKNAKTLTKAGLGISPSMILYGPPGCGKTLAAEYIANELSLPLVTARCDTLVSSYLGSTAKNIRQLFDHASASPCVLFLDEFDALAKARDDQHELGELKRVVVALLQNIDSLPDETILLAASNHEALLDTAVWRRFAYRLEIGLPDQRVREKLISQTIDGYCNDDDLSRDLSAITEGVSCALIEQACKASLRHAVLNNDGLLANKFLLGRLLEVKGWKTEGYSEWDSSVVHYLRELDSKRFTMRRLSVLLELSLAKIQRLNK
jgi:SpoVK/Ycf46/Vps4 family AAA+-type ATPase